MKRIDALKKIIAEMDAEQMGKVLRRPISELLGEDYGVGNIPWCKDPWCWETISCYKCRAAWLNEEVDDAS